MRMQWALCSAAVALSMAACSSDDTASTTTVSSTTSPEPAAPADGPTPLEIRVAAQEQLGRAVNGVDYECDMPDSTEPGTEFNCAGELNGNELGVIATINPDGTVTLAMLD